jgi:ribosomal protein S18 acetylase RimI-like enzyme
MDIVVRKAVCQDSADMAETVCSSWKYAYKGIVAQDYLDKLTSERWKDKFYNGIESGLNDYYVLEYDGKVIGASMLSRSLEEDFPDDAELVCFYLRPEFIGKGLGQNFFDGIHDYIAAKGYAHMILNVLSGNERAICFYKKQGFETLKKSVEITLEDNTYTCDYMRATL